MRTGTRVATIPRSTTMDLCFSPTSLHASGAGPPGGAVRTRRSPWRLRQALARSCRWQWRHHRRREGRHAQTPLLSSHLRERRGGRGGMGESQCHPLMTTWGRSRRSVANGGGSAPGSAGHRGLWNIGVRHCANPTVAQSSGPSMESSRVEGGTGEEDTAEAIANRKS